MKKLLFIACTLLINLSVSASTIEDKQSEKLLPECCTRSVYDEEGDLLLSVRDCSPGSGPSSYIAACAIADAHLERLLKSLWPA